MHYSDCTRVAKRGVWHHMTSQSHDNMWLHYMQYRLCSHLQQCLQSSNFVFSTFTLNHTCWRHDSHSHCLVQKPMYTHKGRRVVNHFWGLFRGCASDQCVLSVNVQRQIKCTGNLHYSPSVNMPCHFGNFYEAIISPWDLPSFPFTPPTFPFCPSPFVAPPSSSFPFSPLLLLLPPPSLPSFPPPTLLLLLTPVTFAYKQCLLQFVHHADVWYAAAHYLEGVGRQLAEKQVRTGHSSCCLP